MSLPPLCRARSHTPHRLPWQQDSSRVEQAKTLFDSYAAYIQLDEPTTWSYTLLPSDNDDLKLVRHGVANSVAFLDHCSVY